MDILFVEDSEESSVLISKLLTSGEEQLGFALFRRTQFPDKTRVSSPVLTARSLATRSLR
jgi:hypothetical protein